MTTRASLRNNKQREYNRITAWNMREEKKSLSQIAEFLNVSKKTVSALLKEYKRFNTQIVSP